MKFRYLPLLAVGVIAVGCGSKSGSGDTASNTDSKATTSSTTTGSADATTGTSTGTTGSTTGTTGTTGAAAGTTGTTTGTTGAPATAPGTTAKPGAAPAPGTPGATPPKMTPEQQKEMQAKIKEYQEKMKAKMAENAAKADKATKSKIEGVSGTYKIQIDDSKLTPEQKASPQYKMASQATLVVKEDGTFTLNGLAPVPITGFTSKMDGKPALVIQTPDMAVKQGAPKKQIAPITVTDGGATIAFGTTKFKRS